MQKTALSVLIGVNMGMIGASATVLLSFFGVALDTSLVSGVVTGVAVGAFLFLIGTAKLS